MDLAFHGRRDLARAFAEAYFRASGDEEGRALLPFYTAYRAAVRGKVEGMKLAEPEVPEAERAAALVRGPGPLAAGPGRAGGAGPAAVPGPGRRPARHRQVHPGPGPGRAGRLHRDPLGRGAQGAGRPRRGQDRGRPPSRRGSTPRRGPSGPTPSACAGPRGSCSRASGSWWTRASARRRTAASSWSGRPLGRAGGPPALPGRAGHGAGGGSKAAGMMPPTPTGRSTSGRPSAGRNVTSPRDGQPGGLLPTESSRWHSPGHSRCSEGWTCWNKAEQAEVPRDPEAARRGSDSTGRGPRTDRRRG